MADKLHPVINVLIFCATVVGMFFFILFVAQEVKTPPEVADERLVCKEDNELQCRVSDALRLSWRELPTKAKEVERLNLGDTLALLSLNPNVDAHLAADGGDYTLIALDRDGNFPGVECHGNIPGYVFSINRRGEEIDAQSRLPFRVFKDYAQTYNRVMVLRGDFPETDGCKPVIRYVGSPSDKGVTVRSFDLMERE